MSPPSKRKRYIFQLAVDQLNSKVEAWDPEGDCREGYGWSEREKAQRSLHRRVAHPEG